MRNALLVLALALSSSASAQNPGPSISGVRPRLIVVVSVDQMRHDYLDRFKPLFTGAFRTLIERGALFSNARYRHANCETGPGHSVILSGRGAWQSGIVANSWFDASLGRQVNVVDDPTVRPVGGEGRGASPANFIGFTLGDMLKKASPEAKVVGISMKDRAAILMAGPRGDAAHWYEQATGRFITSSYYMKTAPSWLEALNRRGVPDSYAGKAWTRLLADESLYVQYAGEDSVPTEADTKDTTFPHALPGISGAPSLYDRFRRTPFMDELTLEKRFPGAKDLVASYLAPDFYLNLDSIARQGLLRKDVEQTIGDALMATGDVAKIYTASSFAGDIPPLSEDPYFDAVRRSYFAPRSPHVIARLKEYIYLTSSSGGTGHGTSYEYDRHVPVVFMGPGVKAGTHEGDAAPEDIAPTLGVLLGIDYPLQDARRRLTETIQH